MFEISLQVVKMIGAPGSLSMLAVGCAIGLVTVHYLPRGRRLGRLWLFGLAYSYVILGLPITANAIARRLPDIPRLDEDRARRTDILDVFDGDNRRGRLAETLRIYRLASPQLVMVSGEPWLFDAMKDAGIPKDRLRQTTSATNTRTQVDEAARLLGQQPRPRVTIVASRLQMPRVAGLVHAAHLDVALAPSLIDDEPPTSGLKTIIPSYIALRVSRDALYEYAALRYYARHAR